MLMHTLSTGCNITACLSTGWRLWPCGLVGRLGCALCCMRIACSGCRCRGQVISCAGLAACAQPIRGMRQVFCCSQLLAACCTHVLRNERRSQGRRRHTVLHTWGSTHRQEWSCVLCCSAGCCCDCCGCRLRAPLYHVMGPTTGVHHLTSIALRASRFRLGWPQFLALLQRQSAGMRSMRLLLVHCTPITAACLLLIRGCNTVACRGPGARCPSEPVLGCKACSVVEVGQCCRGSTAVVLHRRCCWHPLASRHLRHFASQVSGASKD